MASDFTDIIKARDAALLSLDRGKIRDYMAANGVRLPETTGELGFWVAVHKARTGARTLPMEARIQSKRWLTERGFSSFDDGDIPDEMPEIEASR